MDITNINLGACPLQYLSIGYVGETGARPVAFDFSAWATEYGSGVLQLLLQRPGDAEPYPVLLDIDGTTATWTPDATDTAAQGQGQAQLVYTVGGVIVKNAIFRVLIAPSLGAAGNPPEPYEDWLERLLTIAAEAQQSALDAAESAEAAGTSAGAAAGSAGAAAQSALDAEAAKSGAEAAEQTAQQAAALARAKAAEAAEAGQIAGENADYAQQQRIMAEADAVDAHDSAESAAQSAEDAQAASGAAQTAASAAAASASAAAGSAADAASAVTEVETKGAEQIQAIGAAGTDQITAVGEAGAAQVAAIEDKGEEVIASIPSDYTELADDVSDLKSSTNALESDSMTSAKCMDDDSTADLNVTDEDGNVLARFASGEVETKNFASYRSPKTAQTTATGSDLDVIDAGGNVILRLADGHIISKNFDSRTDTRRWVGKKWAAVGDSLTEINQRTTLHYHDYVAERTGISVVNLGHSGAGYYARPSDYSFQIRAGQVPLDSDVVTIFGSGNDVGKKNLGDVTDTVSADTLCGYINNTFDLLFARFTTVNLGVITPTPWKNGSNNWTPENPGNPMELYCEAIVEICKRRSIPCLDLYHCSNLRPMDADFRAAAYSKDEGNGIHPDETGHFLITARFEAFLDSLLLH